MIRAAHVVVCCMFSVGLLRGHSGCAEADVVRLFKTSFAGIYAKPPIDGFKFGLPRIAPEHLCTDLNGDHLIDFVALGTVDSAASQDTLRGITVTVRKPLAKGQQRVPGQVPLLSYKGERVLFILMARPKGHAGIDRIVVVDFADNDAITMSELRDSPSPAAYPHVGIIAPPVLRGVAVRFAANNGRGTMLYWDGQLIRWYPIEASP